MKSYRVGLFAAACGAFVFISPIFITFGENCDYARDAENTCMTASTHNCRAEEPCQAVAPNSGTFFTGNLIYSTSAGSSVFDGKEDIDCRYSVTCTLDETIPDAICVVALQAGNCDNSDGDTCYWVTTTEGQMQTVKSTKIKPCSS